MPRVAAFPLVAALLLPGCPDPNLYTTPRTLDAGKVQLQLAPAFTIVNDQRVTSTARTITIPGATSSPLLSFGARIGVLEGFELGIREELLIGAAAMDAKVRLLRGRLDVALDPGVQVIYGVEGSPTYFHAPVLLGFNASDWLPVVFSPGFAYATAAGSYPETPPSEGYTGPGLSLPLGPVLTPLNAANGAMARIGCGLHFRVTRKLAIHPEVTFLRPFDENVLVAVVGIGFDVSAQPDYSDLAGTPSAPLAPAAPSLYAAPPSAPPSPADPGY